MRKSPVTWCRAAGFTLLEVVIVLGIVGILAGLAIPSYQRYVYRAEAAEVVLRIDRIKGALTELQAVTGKRVGSELAVSLQSGSSVQGDGIGVNAVATPTPSWCPVQGSACAVGTLQPIPGLSGQDLLLPDKGIVLGLAAHIGTGGAQPGVFVVTVAPTSRATHPRQIALAVADIMRPHATKVQVASAAVRLNFQLGPPGKP